MLVHVLLSLAVGLDATPAPHRDYLPADRHDVTVHRDDIPAFARKYRTGCTTCHTAAPKLNVLGEAFRLNGFRFPENDALLRRDATVPLGGEPSKDLWPRAIWPAELPGEVPLAVRIQNDLSLSRAAGGNTRLDFRLPHEVYLLGAAVFDRRLSTFLETEWSRDEGLEVVQAKLMIHDLIPGVPPRALNLSIGLQNLYLFSFADRQIDRAARQPFRWQGFRVSDVELRAGDATLRSENEFRLPQTQPALEANGLVGGRLAWGAGIAQGTEGPRDNNETKDVYYRARYKLGGLALDGSYRPGAGPVLGGQGQLQDQTLIVEHFGYFGREPTGLGGETSHRAFGVNARLIHGPLDLGVGFVWGRSSDPWSSGGGSLTYQSLFAKGEVMFFPWLLGSLKLERFTLALPPIAVPGYQALPQNETGVLPGVIALVRQNLRLVVEGESYLSHGASRAQGLSRPANLWVRLDLAF